MRAPTFPIGFETEFEVSHRTESSAINLTETLLQNLVRKNGQALGSVGEDGSLRNGMEFSSSVCASDDFVFPTFDAVWEKYFAKVQAVDVFVRSHCGMHVHVAKSALSKLDIAKLNYFVVRNRELCEMVGHRSADGAQYFPAREHSLNAIRYDDTEKYAMMGLRSSTVEFRFFKSTWNYKCFLQNMQFVVAMVAFVKSGANSLRDFQKRDGGMVRPFVDFVVKNKLVYKHLYAFLVLKKQIKAPKYRGRKTLEYKAKTAQRFHVSGRTGRLLNVAPTIPARPVVTAPVVETPADNRDATRSYLATLGFCDCSGCIDNFLRDGSTYSGV